MKHLLLSLLLLGSLASYSQIVVQAGLGGATSGGIHPIAETDIGWNFEQPFHNISYQATLGYTFNPYIEKTIYNVKVGAHVKDWTVKVGVGLVNQWYQVSERYSYVSAYNILIFGAERYINKWGGNYHKVYYGVDFIDGHFYGKMGVRFQYKVK